MTDAVANARSRARRDLVIAAGKKQPRELPKPTGAEGAAFFATGQEAAAGAAIRR